MIEPSYREWREPGAGYWAGLMVIRLVQGLVRLLCWVVVMGMLFLLFAGPGMLESWLDGGREQTNTLPPTFGGDNGLTPGGVG